MTVDATAPVICHRPCEALRGVGQDRACFASVVGWFLHRNAYVSIVKHHLLRCRAAVWALADDRYRAPRGDADLVRRGAGQEDGGENEGHEQYAWHVLRDGPAGKLASVSLLRPIQSTVSIGFPNAERACPSDKRRRTLPCLPNLAKNLGSPPVITNPACPSKCFAFGSSVIHTRVTLGRSARVCRSAELSTVSSDDGLRRAVAESVHLMVQGAQVTVHLCPRRQVFRSTAAAVTT